jgi:alpha-tubulin suppressor-like RCC1 family protein
MGKTTDLFEISAISAGKDQTLVMLKSGEVLGWGGPGSGRYVPPYKDICGAFKESDPKSVYVSAPSHYSNISAGYGISLGISDKKPFAWGFSQIGLGANESITEAPSAIAHVTIASKVAAGQFLFGVIDEAGSIYTWGLNVDGALGRKTTQINVTAATIPGIPPMQDVVIGDNFMLALSHDKKVYAWGSNSSGQLGLGHLNTIYNPERVDIPHKIKSLAAGSTHVLALTEDGKVFGWGSNHFNQSGDTKPSFITRPTQIRFSEPISAVAAGMHYSLALASSGKVYAWGWNGMGQLGLGDLESRSSPVPIPDLSGVRAISAGEMHSVAIGKNHLFGWGCNASNQIGKADLRQMTPNSFLEIA